MTTAMTECKNCHNRFEGNYCNYCGQKATIKRFSLANVHVEFFHGIFHLEKGLIHTLRELSLRPALMLREYIAGKRVAYIKPFSYLVLICLVGAFLYPHAGILEHVQANFFATSGTVKFSSEHYLYRMLLTIPVCASLCRIVFRSCKYNLAEHLIINTYIISQSLLIITVWLLALCFIKLSDRYFVTFTICIFLITIIYPTVVLAHLFNSGRRMVRWIKAAAVVLSGFTLSFVIINILTGFIT